MLSSLVIIKWNKKSLNVYEVKAKLIRRVNHPHQVTFLEVPSGCKLSCSWTLAIHPFKGNIFRAGSSPGLWLGVRGRRREKRMPDHIDSIYVAQDISGFTDSN